MLDELKQLKYKYDNVVEKRQQVIKQLDNLEQQIKDKDSELSLVLESRELYKRAIDVIYEKSVEELKSLLNTVLTHAFPDREFEMDIKISDKRGKSLSFMIYEDGKPVNLKVGTGMGVKCVISAVLQMYYIQCKGSNILLLDEAYSNISKSYVPEFFEFLRQLCHRLGFKVILITHDERFLEFADKSYIFNRGQITSHART